MMNNEQKQRGRFWNKRAIFFPVTGVAIIFLLSWVVMLLWNNILPTIIGVKAISFWQSMGILALSKILFSGFKGGDRRPEFHHNHKQDFPNRRIPMSREEREKMRAEWKESCEQQAKQE